MKQQYAVVPVHQVTIARNVRREATDLDELARSIATHGILEPLVGCRAEDGTTVELLMGQRRFAAAQIAGLAEVPFMLRSERPSERDRVVLQLAENLDRLNMSAIDEAIAFRDLVAAGLKQVEVAKLVHRSQAHVSRTLRLLDLPQIVQDAIHHGRITVSCAVLIPPSLFGKPHSMARLKDAIRLGDKGVRRWMYLEARGKPTADESRAARQLKAVDIAVPLYNLARVRADDDGLPVRRWIERLIEEAVA